MKATDKAFITHTSDSTIRIALDYFGSHGPKLRRAEALYYKGRVLSDLNDYAPALDAYDDALTILGPVQEAATDTASLRLRSVILSQNAQLLGDLRLYPEAIPFYRKAAEYSIVIRDTINAMLDWKMVIYILCMLDSVNSAEIELERVSPFLKRISESDQAEMELTRRYLLFKQAKYKEAVEGINTVLSAIEPRFRNFGLMIATKSYQRLGLRDSANHSARILSQQKPFDSNKISAYYILTTNSILSNELDSISYYFNKYDSLYSAQFNVLKRKPTLISTEFLKYRMEQKESLRLRNKNHTLTLIIALAGFLIFLLTTFYLVNRNRNTLRILQQERKEKLLLAQKLDLEQSNASLEEKNNLLTKINSDLQQQSLRKLNSECSREALIDDIIHNYYHILKTHNNSVPVSSSIYNSDVSKRIRMRKSVPPTDKIWSELNSALCNEAPGFMDVITTLHPGSKDILHIIMLIRAGFRPNEIAQLLSRSKNTISSHRSAICENFFMGKITITELDGVIRSISAS